MPRARLFVAMLAALGSASLSIAHAQAPARYVVVTADTAPLRSGDLERFYRVADLKPGEVLRVLDEENGWLRVAYPSSQTAFVRARDADRQGNEAVLNKPRKLRAANLSAGFNGSWKSLLDEPLPAGTRLPIIEEVVGPDGNVAGFRVPAPSDASGFVAQRLTAAATRAQIDRALREAANAQPEIPETPIQTPRSAPVEIPPVADRTPSAPAPIDATTIAGSDATSSPTNAVIDQATGRAMDQATDQASDAIATGSIPTPAPAASSTPAPVNNAFITTPADNSGSTITQAPPATMTSPPAEASQASMEPTIADATGIDSAASDSVNAPPGDETSVASAPRQPTLAELEQSFMALQGQPVETTVVTPLLEAYRDMLGRLSDSPADRRRAERIGHRIQLLELREDFRDRLLALRDTRENPSTGLDAPRIAADIPATPAPTTRAIPTDIRISVRGQLAPSLIYNGQGLPLLYRLIAPEVDGSSAGARTLAYLEPDAAAGLASSLGSIVEVEGVARLAQGSQVRVIDADTFRVLERR
ncbi:MAG: hypothetical protein AAGK04_04630 [Planctomycetota bacterium]